MDNGNFILGKGVGCKFEMGGIKKISALVRMKIFFFTLVRMKISSYEDYFFDMAWFEILFLLPV